MSHHKQNQASGFTRLDLLAIVALTSLLVLSIVPAIGKSHASVLSAGCLNNKRLLMQAFLLYANENDGWFPPSNIYASRGWVSGNVNNFPEATNSMFLTSPSYCALAPYLGGKAAPFKCPAENKLFTSGTRSWKALRSVSMNASVGTMDPGFKKAAISPWLSYKSFYSYGRLSDVVNPKPSDLWAILDEASDSINDPVFAFTGPGEPIRIFDWPATYHDFGAGFGFMDGHAEIHSWQTSVMITPNPVTVISFTTNIDHAWLSGHGTARIPLNP